MLSSHLEKTLQRAFDIAETRQHELATLEHLLLALTEDQDACAVLDACGVELEKLRADLLRFIDRDLAYLIRKQPRNPLPTTAFQRAVQRAAVHVQSSGRDEVTGAHLLVALFSESDSNAVWFLEQQGMSRFDAVNYLSHGIAKVPGKSIMRSVTGVDTPEGKTAWETLEGVGGHRDQDENGQPESALASWCVNLNDKAASGGIDPLIGRVAELERTIQVLCRRRKNNPLFVGEAGVGKTALVEGLALRIQAGEVPEILADAVVWSLDIGTLLAGTRYRGDFEDRMKRVMAEIGEQPHAILFIDEIHTVIGAGSTSGGSMDAANLLKPALQAGQFRCIGSSTYKEYRNHIEKDHALTRRFQKIDVLEPGQEEAVAILKGLKSRYEEHHGVCFSPEAIRAAVELAARYITDRKLPDKAIDVMDEAGAAERLKPAKERRERIDTVDIEAVVARMARIPPKNVSRSDREVLRHLERELKRLVFGQDEAIDALCAAIKLSRAGLREPEKPIGSYLFSGPTGVGKTEVARQLALTLGVELLRFDMSEYMEKHSIARLIGAPPGYVGFDQGGLLTDAVDQHPFSVLLLDEIEKADPDIFNILLQVMDHGTLTDHNGKKIDFRNVILIMTTNAGASDLARAPLGFLREHREGEDSEAIKRLFTPEFRNRLDAIIPFAHLPMLIVQQVVDKFIMQLEAQLAERHVSVELDRAARDWLASHGYDQSMGARPLARLIQERIKKPLAEELLFGRLRQGGRLRISLDQETDKLIFLIPDSLPVIAPGHEVVPV